MAPNTRKVFNSMGEPTAVKHFQIRLDESNIVLRGPEHEAPAALLKGHLVLCLSDYLKINAIRLRFTGEKRVAWIDNYASGNHCVKHVDEFLRTTWDFKKSSETLPPGNYEFPFETLIPGDSTESLEGLDGAWVVYRMKAVIERGIFSRDCVCRKQVRVVRSLSADSLEFSHSMSVENTWVNKLQYFINTPAKAVVFGSIIRVDFTLIPLLKGLKMGKITTELMQRQTLTMDQRRSVARQNSHSTSVYTDTYEIPEHTETEDIDGQEGYQFSRTISVPRNLRQCVQTFETPGIKIRHHLSFNVRMHNPDGHVSELHANLPMHIILSPHLPIDDDHNLIDGSNRQIALIESEIAQPTPPIYGEHHLDQLYSDIDSAGYNTPAATASGVSTPEFAGGIPSASAENLPALDTSSAIPEGVPVGALTNRLSSLSNLSASLVSRSWRSDRSMSCSTGPAAPPSQYTPHGSAPSSQYASHGSASVSAASGVTALGAAGSFVSESPPFDRDGSYFPPSSSLSSAIAPPPPPPPRQQPRRGSSPPWSRFFSSSSSNNDNAGPTSTPFSFRRSSTSPPPLTPPHNATTSANATNINTGASEDSLSCHSSGDFHGTLPQHLEQAAANTNGAHTPAGVGGSSNATANLLAKVPSYTTALATPTRTPVSYGLPSYQAAVRSTPPSPPPSSAGVSLSGGVASAIPTGGVGVGARGSSMSGIAAGGGGSVSAGASRSVSPSPSQSLHHLPPLRAGLTTSY